ncbi:hypothetical protein ABH945_002950 [Paraburkholderia sp. GAS333]
MEVLFGPLRAGFLFLRDALRMPLRLRNKKGEPENEFAFHLPFTCL